MQLRNTSEIQTAILKAIAPLNKFVDSELGTVVSKRLGLQLEADSLWLTDIMLKAGLIAGDYKEGYSVTKEGKNRLDELGGIEPQWQYIVDNWAAQYYLTLANRFEKHEPGSSQEIIYLRASTNHKFHHNRLNHIEE
ncbi:MAG: hypothetical protein E6R05_03540 [Candidatus Moraniibacteriota bacterium]|nr:MAG: hypothetical protein E6R05_03540 [Candidatus Moranbacteria bacterium]